MNRMFVLVFGVMTSVILIGCNQEQPSDEASSASASVKTDRARDDVPPGATLQVVPGVVASCQVGAVINPVVSWQRIDPTVQTTRVMTDNPANPEEKLFAKAGFGGSSRAGNWVVAGTRFHVYDDQTGVELASFTVKAPKNCAE